MRIYSTQLLTNSDKPVQSEIAYPLEIEGKRKRYLSDYHIYGNSVQSAEPTPDAAVEVQSVGTLITEGEHEGKYKVPVTVRGKNLWNKDAVKIRTASCSQYSTDGYNITAKGDEGVEYDASAGQIVFYLDYTVPANKQYTISLYATKLEQGIYQTDAHMYYGYYPSNYSAYGKRFYNGVNIGQRIRYSYTFTPTVDINSVTFRLNSHKWLIEADTIQIEVNASATAYEPYTEPVTTDIYLDAPLRAVGDYADYIDFKGKRIVRKVGELTLDGASGTYVNMGDTYELENTWLFAVTGLFTDRHTNGSFKSNKELSNFFNNYGVNVYSTTAEDREGFNFLATTSTNCYFRINKARLLPNGGTMQGIHFKNWVKELYNNGTPLKVYYMLENAVEEAAELPSLLQFKGTAVYETETAIEPSGIQAKYY